MKLFLVTKDGHKIPVEGTIKLLGYDDNDLTQDDRDTRSRYLLSFKVERGGDSYSHASGGNVSMSIPSKNGYTLKLEVKPGIV